MRPIVFTVLFFALVSASAWCKSILILGDSHSCGPAGRFLYDRLFEQGHAVKLYCGVSSRPSHWIEAQAPKGFKCEFKSKLQSRLEPCSSAGNYIPLNTILGTERWDQIIAVFGTNSLIFGKADDAYRELAVMLKNHSKSCVWVGPPNLREDQRRGFKKGVIQKLQDRQNHFYSSLQGSVAPACSVLDSRDLTQLLSIGSETTDGIHRTQAAGYAWGRQILDRLSGNE